jgi:hypothetical protein
MNSPVNLKTSAAALAFFLGPLAWAQLWVEVDLMDDKPAVSSGDAGEKSTENDASASGIALS